MTMNPRDDVQQARAAGEDLRRELRKHWPTIARCSLAMQKTMCDVLNPLHLGNMAAPVIAEVMIYVLASTAANVQRMRRDDSIAETMIQYIASAAFAKVDEADPHMEFKGEQIEALDEETIAACAEILAGNPTRQ